VCARQRNAIHLVELQVDEVFITVDVEALLVSELAMALRK
jgi:hypothetical protein